MSSRICSRPGSVRLRCASWLGGFRGDRFRRSKDFVQITKGASWSRSATDNVHAAIHNRRPEAVAPGRHGCHGLPGVTRRIIRLVFTESTLLLFAAEYINPT